MDLTCKSLKTWKKSYNLQSNLLFTCFGLCFCNSSRNYALSTHMHKNRIFKNLYVFAKFNKRSTWIYATSVIRYIFVFSFPILGYCYNFAGNYYLNICNNVSLALDERWSHTIWVVMKYAPHNEYVDRFLKLIVNHRKGFSIYHTSSKKPVECCQSLMDHCRLNKKLIGCF